MQGGFMNTPETLYNEPEPFPIQPVQTSSSGAPYRKFLRNKAPVDPSTGFKVSPDDLSPFLFDFQRAITAWDLERGRAANWLDCGMGKTIIQLDWARMVSLHTKKPVIIAAPLAVSQQTQREGVKFNIPVTICAQQSDIVPGVNITNYEKLDRFPDPSQFGGIVLDESSILKAFDGKTRKRLTEYSQSIPFRLACTATPAPNDYMELGNHAEYLGVMKAVEMLAMFFVHDGGDTSKWRLKKHATEAFFKFLASFAVALRKPSDIGFPDGPFVLPKLRMHQVEVEDDTTPEGYLFQVEAKTLGERRDARKRTIDHRVAAAAKLANEDRDPWILWCNLNSESESLAKACPDAVEVTGSMKDTDKEAGILGFIDGVYQMLVSKPTIAGYGMNLQHCSKMAFVGLSDSFEQLYQAIRRCWRFGQTKPVDVYVITSSTEGAVVRNIERKERQADQMMEGMVRHMKKEMQKNLTGQQRERDTFKPKAVTADRWQMRLGDCVEEIRKVDDASIDFTVFSPPFSSLYTYSNSDRDMGNSKNMAEFAEHFAFLVPELYRVTKPGRLLSFHCMNLPTSKQNDGVIGIRDFRGELIRMFLGDHAVLMDSLRALRNRQFEAHIKGEKRRQEMLKQAIDEIEYELRENPSNTGFIFHSEVCIWKDPVTAMQRTKAIGLLYKQLRKDSCMSRQGIADYLVTVRKPGENKERVTKVAPPAGGTFKHARNVPANEFPVDRWQNYASPVWMDIQPNDTLTKESAREEDDERHICPLQLGVIERAIELWTNADDLVFSPFAGIGSEGYVAIKMGRRFLGMELKESYWEQAVANLRAAENIQHGLFADGPDSLVSNAPEPDAKTQAG
jgi:DNA modification methylase